MKFHLKGVLVIANRMNMKRGLLEVLLYHHWKKKSSRKYCNKSEIHSFGIILRLCQITTYFNDFNTVVLV